MNDDRGSSVKNHFHLIYQKKTPPVFHVLSDLAWKQIWQEHLLLALALVLLLSFVTSCSSFGNCLGFIFYLT